MNLLSSLELTNMINGVKPIKWKLMPSNKMTHGLLKNFLWIRQLWVENGYTKLNTMMTALLNSIKLDWLYWKIVKDCVDFKKTFAPMAKIDTYCLLLAIVAAKTWELDHAFLHGDLMLTIRYFVTQKGMFLLMFLCTLTILLSCHCSL